MSRQDEFKSNTNPATHYVTWKSNEKTFEAYDKEAKAKDLKKLPFEFTVLKVGSSVKGWNDEQEAAIYSNIITNSIKQDLSVRCGNSVIASGKYQAIKNEVVAAGAHFETNIFAMHDGGIVMISLKGAALGKWFDFTKVNKNKLVSNSVIVKGSLEGKKGAVKFNTPVFELGAVLSVDDANAANKAYDLVDGYLDSPVEEVEATEDVTDMDVDFETITPDEGKVDDLPF